MDFPRTVQKSWYLVNRGHRQWFDKEPLEHVLGVAILMTGMGGISGADEVTLLDSEKKPIVTLVANEKHAGCRLIIPADSETTPEDLNRLNHFMCAYQLIKESVEQTA